MCPPANAFTVVDMVSVRRRGPHNTSCFPMSAIAIKEGRKEVKEGR
jgi:hypothetical protein